MDLILWRHAEAEPGEPDVGRALTAKGRKQALKTGGWLDRHLPGRCKILVSPAVRAVQTAEALGRKFKTHPDLLPDQSIEQLLAAAGWPDGRETVLIVGHQPTLGMAAARLITGVPQAWSVKKASIWWIGQKDDDGEAWAHYVKAVITADLVTRSRD